MLISKKKKEKEKMLISLDKTCMSQILYEK